MRETRESAERTLQASAKLLQLGCGEAPFRNDLNSLPFSKKDESPMIPDTSAGPDLIACGIIMVMDGEYVA
jgi:hypothetical protein